MRVFYQSYVNRREQFYAQHPLFARRVFHFFNALAAVGLLIIAPLWFGFELVLGIALVLSTDIEGTTDPQVDRVLRLAQIPPCPSTLAQNDRTRVLRGSILGNDLDSSDRCSQNGGTTRCPRHIIIHTDESSPRFKNKIVAIRYDLNASKVDLSDLAWLREREIFDFTITNTNVPSTPVDFGVTGQICGQDFAMETYSWVRIRRELDSLPEKTVLTTYQLAKSGICRR